jgi:tetratricopeptide (TPR) repeat protein
VNDYLSTAMDFEEVGNFRKALLYYDSAINEDPENAVIYYNRGACFMQINENGSALVDFNKAISLDAELGDAYFNRAIIHHQMNNLVMAVFDMEQYVALQPFDTMGFMALAELTFKAGDFVRAIDANQKAVENGLERKYIALKNQGVCYRILGSPSMSEYLITLALLEKPDYALGFLERAKSKVESEDYMGALTDIYTYLTDHPNDIEGLSIRALCNFNVKNFMIALDDYEKLIMLDPHNFDWVIEKGNSLLKMKRDADAEDAYNMALTKSNRTGFILTMRGIARFNQKKLEEACQDWNQAVMLGDKGAEALREKHCHG